MRWESVEVIIGSALTGVIGIASQLLAGNKNIIGEAWPGKFPRIAGWVSISLITGCVAALASS